MRYEVTHGRDTFSVEVHEAGGFAFDVRVDDERPVRVDACKTARTVYSILIGGRQYEGSVDEREDGTLDVHVGTSAFDFTVVDERRKALQASAAEVVSGKQELRAQMPGKIVKILIGMGESVEVDQGLLIIEAMKMENELRSPIRGVVTEIAVSEGDAVEGGALLVVIEPPEDS
ncbi:MAG: acetyl-CoA carboxylase biotin carboxyl carrier protein subunit [Myxococcota bacterium]